MPTAKKNKAIITKFKKNSLDKEMSEPKSHMAHLRSPLHQPRDPSTVQHQQGMGQLLIVQTENRHAISKIQNEFAITMKMNFSLLPEIL